MRGIGISLGILLGSTYLTRLQLAPLTLTSDTIQENSVPGTLVGTIITRTTVGTLSLVDSAGSRFALAGNMLVAGSVSTDFETAEFHNITVRENIGSLFRDTVFTITVINEFEQPALNALSLSETLVNNEEVTIFIIGATAGSTISGTMPAGLTLNSALRTITGTLAATSTFNLIETLADSPNSPRTTSLTITLWEPSTQLFAAGEQGYWLDASDFSTMFQDDAGTTPVTAVGQSVGRWLDKSGRGNHFIQSNVANRPILQVDSTGRPFLLWDGSDDFLQSAANINPGAVNKAQVFAGVRKLSDAVPGVLVESSTQPGVNNGSMGLRAPNAIATDNYGFFTRGSVVTIASNTGFVAPITNVVTGLGDISAPSAILRVNGTEVASSTSSQGTGDYLTYQHFIGRRGGVSNPFNGRIYQLITRYGPNLTQDQINRAEIFVAQRTGFFKPIITGVPTIS
jgi:hypothetical protein